MADYIEREALSQAILDLPPKMDEQGYGWLGRRGVWQMVNDFPAADVRPVVRGKWEQKEVFEAKGHVDELQSAFCPVCQRYHTTPYSYYFTNYNFCPNCGADMREES